jgi:hypothetical protein
MKILIINIDSKLPNIALKIIEAYHKRLGDEVIWDYPLIANQVDKIYVSCIFDWNKHKAVEWERYGNAIIGGSGYAIKKTLPEEIEQTPLKINYGFTTRGCIRKCPFCIVPEKEGRIRSVADVYDIWDGKNKDIVLLDNNILALPEHFKLVCGQIKKEGLKVDFNQGLDHRLLTEEIVCILKSIRTFDLRFAYDSPENKTTVERAVGLLNGLSCMWYVLVGFDTTFEEDLERIDWLNNEGQRPYVMRHENCKRQRKYIALARWTNSPLWRNAMSFDDFCERNNYLITTVKQLKEGG